MIAFAWCSSDGESVHVWTHDGEAGLLDWWRTLPGIVGVMVLFEDGTRHRMEASEFYAVAPYGRARGRFWNGECAGCAPDGAHVKPGITVPDEVYEIVSEMMERA